MRPLSTIRARLQLGFGVTVSLILAASPSGRPMLVGSARRATR